MHENEVQQVQVTHEQNLVVPKHFVNPFPNQTPIQLLQRQFRVLTAPWQIGVPFAQTLSFPVALWNPSIIAATKTFKWMRADVEVEVRLNSNPFQFGALLASWIPNHSNTSHCANLYQQSGNNPMVISASKQNSLTFTIPWTCPFAYFECFQSALFMGSQIGRLNITEMFPLIACSTNSTQSAEVSVFARFINVETAAYVTAQAHVKKVKDEGILKSMTGLIDGVTGSSVASEIFTAATSLGKLIGFDYPPSMQNTSNLVIAPGQMAHGKGLDTARSISIDPEIRLPHPGYLMGNKNDVISLYDVISTPMLHRTYTITDTTAMDDIIVRPMDASTQTDYLSYTSNLFRFWRGSIKYLFQFFTSPMISCRFRITLLYTQPVVATDTITSGDAISKIIDVKGDTDVAMAIPYSWVTYYRHVDLAQDTANYPRIKIQAITDIYSPDDTVTPTIYLAVWRAAGHDFQLLQYKAPTRISAQANVAEVFSKDFPMIIGDSEPHIERRFLDVERLITLPDLWKRHGENVLNNSYPSATPTTSHLREWSKIFKHWRGSRRVKTFLSATDTLHAYSLRGGIAAATLPSNGYILTHSFVAPYNESIVPYYSTQPFVLNEANGAGFQTPLNVTDVVETYTTGETHFLAGGDDFTFGYLYAPPLWLA